MHDHSHVLPAAIKPSQQRGRLRWTWLCTVECDLELGKPCSKLSVALCSEPFQMALGKKDVPLDNDEDDSFSLPMKLT